MNFKAAINKINSDLCNTFYAKYMKGEWGIRVGFNTVSAPIALMRKQLADWQEGYDCTNSLCTESKLKTTCPENYSLVITSVYPAGICCYKGCPPGTAPNPAVPDDVRPYAPNGCIPCGGASTGAYAICPELIDPTTASEILSYPQLAQGGECVYNPPLSAKGNCNWNRRFMDVTLLLINSFTR